MNKYLFLHVFSLYRSNFKRCFYFSFWFLSIQTFSLSLYRSNFKVFFCFSFWFLSIQTFSLSLYRSNFKVFFVFHFGSFLYRLFLCRFIDLILKCFLFFVLVPFYTNFISTNNCTIIYIAYFPLLM